MDGRAASLFPDWPQYAGRIRDAVKDLTAEQLALRAGPEHAQIWQLAAHVAGTRVYWLCGRFGEPGAEATPWKRPLEDDGWEDDESQPRSGSELEWALDSSWGVIAASLDRWSVNDLAVTVQVPTAAGGMRTMSRASVLNRAMSHDSFHGGEISQLLGLHHLPPIDLWIRHPTT
jgi:uncharacterized damage-inducible protein DinB